MNDTPKTPRNDYPTQRRNAQIVEMAQNGSTTYDIAEFFHISHQRVTQILNRQKARTNKAQTKRAARYGKTRKIGTNIETKRLDQFTQTRKAHKMGLAEAVEEALRLYIEKYKDITPE